MPRTVIFISGNGSNMENLIDADLPGEVVLVLSNNQNAPCLTKAQERGIKTGIIDNRKFNTRDDFDKALAKEISKYNPDLIALAGFMLILGDSFLDHFPMKVLNIHPSLLPAFPGRYTHRSALKKGVKFHGCTVHFVTSKLDEGPIIIQASVPVTANDSEESLAKKVLKKEHDIYPIAAKLFLEKRLRIVENKVIISQEVKYPDANHSPIIF